MFWLEQVDEDLKPHGGGARFFFDDGYIYGPKAAVFAALEKYEVRSADDGGISRSRSSRVPLRCCRSAPPRKTCAKSNSESGAMRRENLIYAL